MLRTSVWTSLAATAALVAPVMAAAQDHLGVHLETQREQELRRHQQAQASGASETREKYTPPISGQKRHAAMRRHHREYGEVMKARGAEAADQWLAEQVAAGR